MYHITRFESFSSPNLATKLVAARRLGIEALENVAFTLIGNAMGLSDRDYYFEDARTERGLGSHFPSAVALIILLNVVLYFVNQGTGGALFGKMMLRGDLASVPLQWYRCITYGFAHDPGGFWHIFCNMLTLFFFGPVLERLYGKAEFWIFYLGAIFFGGVTWNVLHIGQDNYGALGASGGISAVVILFACKYPKQIVLLYGIFPIPIWLLGIGYVAYDAFGAHRGVDNIGHDIHLAGAAFAIFYFLSNVRFSGLFSKKSRRRTNRETYRINDSFSSSDSYYSSSSSVNPSDEPKKRGGFLSLLKGESELEKMDAATLEAEVDRILGKLNKFGRDSLTKKEEKTLYFASEAYQKRANSRDSR
ncbi:MAG: rhomboid family intramembrane serine protease [Thermoguttaceae bacterium]|nr:rhomboid family intramembrane serine protease [Thermoguttaceae bacterium]